MATEYERPPRHIDRHYENVGTGLGRIVGLIVIVMAILSFIGLA